MQRLKIQSTANFQDMFDSWLPTGYLIEAACTFRDRNDNSSIWASVSGSENEARAYFRRIPADEAREEAALALAYAGVTRAAVAAPRA